VADSQQVMKASVLLHTSCPHKKGATLFLTITRITWSIFIPFASVETGMNAPVSHVIYILNSVMTS